MKKAGRHRILARLLWALAVLGLILSACDYQTIGQLSGTAAPTQASAGQKTFPPRPKRAQKLRHPGLPRPPRKTIRSSAAFPT